jgi:drug/metabolite transporter (DMT)-like permease
MRAPFKDTGVGAAYALLAAVLFGVSAPVSKLLLPGTSPLMLAGLFYLGAGLGLSAFDTVRRLSGRANPEARLRRQDLRALLLIVLFGGVLGPILMLVGLERLSGLVGALLLNLEAPLTIIVAVALFGEHLARREVLAAALLLGGAALLGRSPGALRGDWVGVAAMGGAALCWAIDNNLTQGLSVRDPVAVTRVKALGAGATSLVLAAFVGVAIPTRLFVGVALVVGAGCYGASIVFAIRASRLLGAARQAAFFAVAPFAGAALAIPLLHDRPTMIDLTAAAAMVIGVVFLVRSRHDHVHTHEELVHDHVHTHDEHHQHEHEGGVATVTEPHSHLHRHTPLTHAHPHASDVHHHHRH